MKKVPITIRGVEKLREQLRQLKFLDRPRIVGAIAEARAHGDLRENAEYHAAKEEQAFTEARIRDIEGKLSNAEIIDGLEIPVRVPRHGARFGLLMGLEKEPVNYEDVLSHRRDIMLSFVKEAAQRGVYFCDYGGGPAHHGFGAAHTKKDFDQILQVMEEAFKAVKDDFQK